MKKYIIIKFLSRAAPVTVIIIFISLIFFVYGLLRGNTSMSSVSVVFLISSVVILILSEILMVYISRGLFRRSDQEFLEAEAFIEQLKMSDSEYKLH